SKVFVDGGPYTDLYDIDSSKAKTDKRLENSGELTHYDLFGEKWSASPKTFFYDWLYLTALDQNPELSNELFHYSGFTDIHFNHKTSTICQARSAAIYVTLSNRGILSDVLKDRQILIDL
ncbi:MAG: hypothetical protein IIB77_13730, partial [Proteobacteria bacterium]|nr:hypothetical protein [Pseudomonadota bacterium]